MFSSFSKVNTIDKLQKVNIEYIKEKINTGNYILNLIK